MSNIDGNIIEEVGTREPTETLQNPESTLNGTSREKRFSLTYNDRKRLINDIVTLLKDSNFYDMEVTVGTNQNIETFKIHSVILRARSLYFNRALSNNWLKKNDNGIIIFEKPNISPRIFRIILK
jgi:hypothetical protein